MTIKVMFADTWQPMLLDLGTDETVAGLKRRALGFAHQAGDGAGYEVKFGGGRVKDESRTLGSLGVQEGSAFIVLSRRRRPIR